MKRVLATVHVVSPSGAPSARPAPERVQLVAQALQRLGFDVVRAGRFGVSVQADPQHFEQELGVLPGSATGVQAVSPRDSSLTELVDYLEVMPPSSLADI